MTSIAHYNVGAFEYAAAQWRAAGYAVETPFDCNSRVWQRHYGRRFDPASDVCDYGDPLLAEMFVEDVKALLAADLVAVLPGWEQSRGATRELPIALLFAKPVHDADTFQAIPLACAVSFHRTDESVLEEAQRLIHGDRNASYGDPIDDYTATGRMWAAILSRAWKQTVPDIDPRIACLMMVAVKCSREAAHYKRDNLVDAAGYAGLAQWVAETQAARAAASAGDV